MATARPLRLTGGLVDRTRPLRFQFDGTHYEGLQGDTLASALLANGVRLFGRSFKYHRPRGVLTAGAEEPNALVELGIGDRRDPNVPATTIELFDGLQAASQNRWPSLRLDAMAVNSLAAPLFVAGFYYKTFMWPAALWERLYEPAIRRTAGLGRASGAPDPDAYDKMHAFCDLLVVGAGPAGLAAALGAARAGARVIVCEDDFELGGRLLGDRHRIDGHAGAEWARQAELELASYPEVRLLRRTCVFGIYDGGVHGAVERLGDHLATPPSTMTRQRLWKIAARRTILAAGATERPIVFGGNDRPGVMMASAVRAYLNRFAVAAGRRVAVFTTNDDGWKTAADLLAQGIEVACVVDSRAEVAEAVRATAAGIETILGGQVVDTRGGPDLKAIVVETARGRLKISADVLAMAGGWTPNNGLAAHLGARPVWSDAAAAFLADETPPGMQIVGAANGAFALAEALRQGARSAAALVGELGFPALPAADYACSDDRCGHSPVRRYKSAGSKAFVDFQHDVTDKDIDLAVREGFRSVEHVKRYTTLGMATDQGRTSNVNGHAIVAEATGRSMVEAGTILSRPPYRSVAIAAFAGGHRDEDFRPVRLTTGHRWAAEHGATFTDAGRWRRAQWFSVNGETDWLTNVSHEVAAVRGGVGVCDVSSLGKIDVQGADAGVFLDRIYANTFSTLPVGKARYGVMLREDGFVFDDGTTARLGEDHYLVSTTTANAVSVMQQMEFARQVLWPQLDVQLISVTEQWAQYAIAGRRSLDVVRRVLGPGAPIDQEAFPYLAVGVFEWMGVEARLFRLSFSGEQAYEIAVPAHCGAAMIETIRAAGERDGLVPYGTEALAVMRIEKGHVGGAEINGQTTAADLGLGRLLSRKKDFIGRVMAGRPALVAPDRPTLTGFRPVDPTQRLKSGAHFLDLGAAGRIDNDQGYMTSVAYSPSLGGWIGLGLLRHGLERRGEVLRAYDPVRGGDIEVEACAPVFIDPEGARLHGRY